MATEAVRIGKLYFTFDGYERRPDSNVPGTDELEVYATIENTNRPLGEVGRAPAVELRDGEGGLFEPVNLDAGWLEPAPPDTRTAATLRFRIPESSTQLTLVLAPGEAEEAVVELELVLD
ncbi:MAG: hypothetical protein AB7F65_00170 [Dehalococcoidia bacterium]